MNSFKRLKMAFTALTVGLSAGASLNGVAFADDQMADLSLEELFMLEVTSVAKKPQDPDESAAAITVITAEDLRRAGVTTLPEALRMAPGVEVAEIDGNITAVSIRGFNWRFSNKLLVLVDGRAIYQPSISGIFWDQQLGPVEDIQRIELVRGPGATMWGANAMNGVINIVTKHAADTLRGRATVDVGSDERYRASARYGFRLGQSGAARIYAEGRKVPSLVDPEGEHYNDGMEAWATGFRADFDPVSGMDSITVQGEYQKLQSENTIETAYAGGSINNETNVDKGDGYNLLGRWVRTFSQDHAITLQAYTDHSNRTEFGTTFDVTTYDLDMSHRFRPTGWMDVVWGLNTRRTQDELTSTGGFDFSPSKYTSRWTSGFLQSEIELMPERLRVTVGSKFEDNSFTGFETQPSLRAIWLGEQDWAAWGAVSRAVRTPSRLERSLDTTINQIPANSELNPGPLPVNVSIRGSSVFDAETLEAYELGFRKSWNDTTNLDIALYRHEYEKLLLTESQAPELIYAPVGPGGAMFPVAVDQTLLLTNGEGGTVQGIEFSLDSQLTNAWSVTLTGNVQDLDLRPYDTENGVSGALEFKGDAPSWQAGLRSSFDISKNVDASVWLRHVSEFDNEAVGAYTDFDVRATWQATPDLALSIVGENLLEPRRREINSSVYPTPDSYVERRVLIRAGLRF